MTMLVSLSDMKDYLGETTTIYDTFLTNQITIISDAIEGYCARKLPSASYTQTFYGHDFSQDNDAENLFVYHYPVSAVTSVKEIEKDGDGNDLNTVTLTTDEFLFQPSSGKFLKRTKDGQKRFWFTEYGYHSRIEIEYTAGFVETPTPIQDVVYNLVEQRYNKKVAGIDINFGQDVQRLSVPGVMSIDFDYTLQSNERKTAFGMILGNYVNVLDMYRSERKLIGEIKENYVV